jgi:hypothetical protein
VVGNAIVQNMYASKFNDIMDFATSVENENETLGNKFIYGIVSPFLPLSGIMRNIKELSDSTIRNPKTIVEMAKSQYPLLSKQVPPKEGIIRTKEGSIFQHKAGSALNRAFSPVRVTPVDQMLEKRFQSRFNRGNKIRARERIRGKAQEDRLKRMLLNRERGGG